MKQNNSITHDEALAVNKHQLIMPLKASFYHCLA